MSKDLPKGSGLCLRITRSGKTEATVWDLRPQRSGWLRFSSTRTSTTRFSFDGAFFMLHRYRTPFTASKESLHINCGALDDRSGHNVCESCDRLSLNLIILVAALDVGAALEVPAAHAGNRATYCSSQRTIQ